VPHSCCQSDFELELQLSTVKDYIAMVPYYQANRKALQEKRHLLQIIDVCVRVNWHRLAVVWCV
jgi:hypothetical protein